MPKLDPNFFRRFSETRLEEVLREFKGEAEDVAAWVFSVSASPRFNMDPQQIANLAILAFAVGSDLTRTRMEFERIMEGTRTCGSSSET